MHDLLKTHHMDLLKITILKNKTVVTKYTKRFYG